ncbi:PQQ-binding-like beta-propeller repeat protein [bacterium]|nr:PQQ-binding-like beta-propeller repeat protein [bacterium]
MPRFSLVLIICLQFTCEMLIAQDSIAAPTDGDAFGGNASDGAVEVFNLEESSGPKLVNWTAKIGYSTGPMTYYKNFLLFGGNMEGNDRSGLSGTAMLCVDARTGLLVDSQFHSRLPHRANDMPGQAIKSRLSIDGDRGFYVSNRGELVALELSQLNHGRGMSTPWAFDMVSELGVFKRDAPDIGNPTCSPLIYGDNVYCLTGHGTTFGYRNRFPARFPPNAPSFIAVDKNSGQLIWKTEVPHEGLLLGQWGSPVLVSVEGSNQIVFPGGDGVLYGVDPKNGKIAWSLPCNPPGRTNWTPYRRGTKCFFDAKPTVHDEMLFVSLCQDVETQIVGQILAIDLKPIAKGKMPKVIWTYENEQFGQTSGELSYHDGRLYGVSRSGKLIVLDAKNGKELSLQSIGGQASLLGSLQIANGQIFVCSDDELIRYSLADTPKCCARYHFRRTVENSPLIVGKEVFVTTRGLLWSINLE